MPAINPGDVINDGPVGIKTTRLPDNVMPKRIIPSPQRRQARASMADQVSDCSKRPCQSLDRISQPSHFIHCEVLCSYEFSQAYNSHCMSLIFPEGQLHRGNGRTTIFKLASFVNRYSERNESRMDEIMLRVY